MPKPTCTVCGNTIKKSLALTLPGHCGDCTTDKLGRPGGARGSMVAGIHPIDVLKVREPQQLADQINADRKAGIKYVA